LSFGAAVLEDFDADGLPDLALSRGDADEVVVFR
jgi:hypothetical protein